MGSKVRESVADLKERALGALRVRMCVTHELSLNDVYDFIGQPKKSRRRAAIPASDYRYSLSTGSSYIGVSKARGSVTWRYRIYHKGVEYSESGFASELDAAAGYNVKAVELKGSKAKLNLI